MKALISIAEGEAYPVYYLYSENETIRNIGVKTQVDVPDDLWDRYTKNRDEYDDIQKELRLVYCSIYSN